MSTPTLTKLQLKLAESSDERERFGVIEVLEKLGASDVRRLFPTEENPQLASLYVAVLPAEIVGTAISQLRSHPAVEFIEEQPTRKLIR